MAKGDNPLDDFWTWIKRNSFEGPDLLTGYPQRRDAMNLLKEGLEKSHTAIKGAYGEAKAAINPYAQAGMEDFNNYRDMVYGGYFDQPYGGTYQTPQYQNQGFNPGAYNPQTASYGNSYTPYQTQGMNISQPGLPGMPSQSHTAVAPQTPQQQTGSGTPSQVKNDPVNDELLNQIREVFGLSTNPRNEAMLGRLPMQREQWAQQQGGLWPGGQSKPVTVRDLINSGQYNPGGSGPFNPSAGGIPRPRRGPYG